MQIHDGAIHAAVKTGEATTVGVSLGTAAGKWLHFLDAHAAALGVFIAALSFGCTLSLNIWYRRRMLKIESQRK